MRVPAAKNHWPELCCKIWAKLPSLTWEKLSSGENLLLFICFVSFLSEKSIMYWSTCVNIFTCTGTHLILHKCRTCELSFWATENCKQCRGKEKGGEIYNICCWAHILGTLLWKWVSVVKEMQNPTCTWHSFCSELLLAAITSVFKLIFEKLVFIHHLSC